MIYPIVLYGDPVLKRRGDDIEKDSLDVKQLAQDMFDTMYQASGVGLAAPQIGKSIRMFIIDSSPMEEDKTKGIKKVFINPQIVSEEGEPWAFEEGCLSIPGIREDVYRKPKIRIQYFDEEWNAYDEVYDDIVARIIQHEYDHIEGVLFSDHISTFKKRLLKGRLFNISKGKIDVDYRFKVPAKR